MAENTASSPASSRGSWSRRLWVGLVAILVLVAGGLYVWKLVAVNRVEDAMEAQRDSLMGEAEDRLQARTRELLGLSAVPLGFAIRQPTLDGNYGLVGEYLSGLVQEPGVRQAMVVDRGDSILVATNRNLQGRPVSAADLPGGLLPASETTVRPASGGSWFAAVPLTGINRTVGTLILEYRPERGAAVRTSTGRAERLSWTRSSRTVLILPADTRRSAAPRSSRPS